MVAAPNCRVLVTGGAGYIGSLVVRTFRGEGIEVVARIVAGIGSASASSVLAKPNHVIAAGLSIAARGNKHPPQARSKVLGKAVYCV